jgi:hypothetical protein
MTGTQGTTLHTRQSSRDGVTNTKCRTDTVISPVDGHIVAPKHAEKRNKHTKKNCAPSWLYLQDYTKDRRSTKHKITKCVTTDLQQPQISSTRR